jgi:uncharacterized protein (TIGR02246 family)
MNANPLLELEAIKQLKARYFRCMDTKDWEGFAEVFTPEAELDVTEDAGADAGRVKGREQIVAGIQQVIGAARTVHHGHMPEIKLTGPDRAEGIWAMYDYVEFASEPQPVGIRGYGHYHETYEKSDGQWRIARMRLSRLRRDPL